MHKQRIFELATQAGFTLLDTGNGKCIVDDKSDRSAIEVFAALIAKDVRAQTMEWCAKKCEDTGAYRDELDMALECAEAIRAEV